MDYGKEAAESGKHVIVEKPIEVTVERGKDLIESCEKNGVELAVIYQNRFSDEAMKMKKVLNEGGIGGPVLASAKTPYRNKRIKGHGLARGGFVFKADERAKSKR